MTTPRFDASSTAEQVTEGLDLKGTTWLITGCNSGLGYETARVLAKRGGRIVGLARTKDKAARALEAIGADGAPVACELSDLDSVRAAVDHVKGLDQLDGIIANAGIMALPELEQIAGIERQFFTNHIGHFALVTGLLDRLAHAGRVVMVSSGAHRYAENGLELDNISGEHEYAAWRMYGRSKLANIVFALGLSERFKGTAKTANSLHPGVIQTNLGRHIVEREAMYEQLKHMLRTVEQGAATQTYLATHPSLAEVSGTYFADCAPAKVRPEGEDVALAEELWERTEQIIAAL